MKKNKPLNTNLAKEKQVEIKKYLIFLLNDQDLQKHLCRGVKGKISIINSILDFNLQYHKNW